MIAGELPSPYGEIVAKLFLDAVNRRYTTKRN